MKPGREMDALVANKVMGWIDYSSPCNGDPDGLCPETFVWVPIPHYSTDIAEAMKVWQKLRGSGKFCCLNICSDYHYTYDIILTEASDHGGAATDDHAGKIVASGEDLPFVICLAALKAIGGDK